MNKITKQIFIHLTLFALLSLPLLNTDAIDVTWNIGDNFEYQYRLRDYVKITYVDFNTEFLSDIKFDTTFQINITDIDNSTETIDFDSIGVSTYSNSYSYDAQDFVDSTEVLTNHMNIATFYDTLNNRTGIQDFVYDFYVVYFLEPNWSIINNAFANSLNTSTILATVPDPYDPIIYNITFGDLLGLMSSYTINGVVNDINAALTTFTADRTSWSFIWDLSNSVEYSYFNGSHTIYSPIEKFIYTNELGYTSAGVLNNYKYQFDIKYSNEANNTIELFYILEYALGQLTPTDESNYTYLIVIPAIASVFVTTIVLKRRK